MNRVRRGLSSVPKWLALVGATSFLRDRFIPVEDSECGTSYTLESQIFRDKLGDARRRTDSSVGRPPERMSHGRAQRLPGLLDWFIIPQSMIACCKPEENHVESVDGQSVDMRVKKAVMEVWTLLDHHVHRVSGSLSAGSRHQDGPLPDPKISIDDCTGIFHVEFTIPREVMPSVDLLVKGLQQALRQGHHERVSLSKQDTYGSEGRASAIRVHTSGCVNLTVDMLQPFDGDEMCRLEFGGDANAGNLDLMSNAIEYVTTGNHAIDRSRVGYNNENYFNTRDPESSMMFDSLEEMMRMFLERGMTAGGQFPSDPFAGLDGGMRDERDAYHRNRIHNHRDMRTTRSHSSESEDDDAAIAQRLETMGCQVYFPKTDNNHGTVDWGTLAGYEDQKTAIEENLLLPLRKPDVYDGLAKKTRAHYSSNRPRAVLFTGPPGTGKTSSARVIAQQASVPLCYIPLEALASKWYGESEKKLAEALAAIDRFKDGAVLFLDELDSLATARGSDMHEATRRTLGVLLRHLDGFDLSKKTVVIGATNRPDDLDSALLSRFSATIHFGLPTENCRISILKQYAKQLSENDIRKLAKITENMSGRDLRDVCEVAERHWATLIIQGKVKSDSLPGLDTYLMSVRARKNSFGK